MTQCYFRPLGQMLSAILIKQQIYQSYAPLKLRPYGAIEIRLLLLLLFNQNYRLISFKYHFYTLHSSAAI